MFHAAVGEGKIASPAVPIGRQMHPMSSLVMVIGMFSGFGLFSLVPRYVHVEDPTVDGLRMFVEEDKNVTGIAYLAELGFALRFSGRAIHVVTHRVATRSQNLRFEIDRRAVGRAVIDSRLLRVPKQTAILNLQGGSIFRSLSQNPRIGRT